MKTLVSSLQFYRVVLLPVLLPMHYIDMIILALSEGERIRCLHRALVDRGASRAPSMEGFLRCSGPSRWKIEQARQKRKSVGSVHTELLFMGHPALSSVAGRMTVYCSF